jgi:hypothetical protein
MEVRRRALPAGWYPVSARDCRREVEDYLRAAPPRPEGLERVRGGIVPHAGWLFSGRLAAWAFAAAAAEKPEVVILFGGHLGQGPPRLILEDAWETPLGPLEIARELAGELARRLPCQREPEVPDNTLEIHLPMLKYLFPEVKLLAVRAPHTEVALRLGQEAAKLCRERGLTCLAFGSTDLTHYGPDYGFMPVGLGERALGWVKGTNDARFIKAALELDAEALLRLGPEEGSACSAGAAAAAVAAGRVLGAERGRLLASYTSADVAPFGESFVGYAAITF